MPAKMEEEVLKVEKAVIRLASDALMELEEAMAVAIGDAIGKTSARILLKSLQGAFSEGYRRAVKDLTCPWCGRLRKPGEDCLCMERQMVP